MGYYHRQLFPMLSYVNVHRPCADRRRKYRLPRLFTLYKKAWSVLHHSRILSSILPLALFVSGRLVYQLSVCCLKMVRNKLQRLPQSVICACLTYRESNSQSVVCETLIHRLPVATVQCTTMMVDRYST